MLISGFLEPRHGPEEADFGVFGEVREFGILGRLRSPGLRDSLNPGLILAIPCCTRKTVFRCRPPRQLSPRRPCRLCTIFRQLDI